MRLQRRRSEARKFLCCHEPSPSRDAHQRVPAAQRSGVRAWQRLTRTGQHDSPSGSAPRAARAALIQIVDPKDTFKLGNHGRAGPQDDCYLWRRRRLLLRRLVPGRH